MNPTAMLCGRCGGDLRFDDTGELTGCSSGCSRYLIEACLNGHGPSVPVPPAALSEGVGAPDNRAIVQRPARDLEPIDGTELLDAITGFITRYMVLPSREVEDLLALWVLHTHTVEANWATPYLRITSATPDSGKTQLMEILAALTRRGWRAINPSSAVLYRKIDRDAPTLLLDEMDNFPLDDRRDALAVLNAGYKRGATADRCMTGSPS